MSLRNPLGRNQRDWGNYASLNACPKAAGTAVPINQTDGVLEAGDVVYITGSGRAHCTSAGTAGVNDATWALTGTVTPPPIQLVFTGAATVAGKGTDAVVIGAVYLTNGTSILATSNAFLGTAAGGTGTVRLRRQGTGVLLAGAQWDYTGVGLSDDALAGAVAVGATDWYTIELVGDVVGTVALAYGLTLNF